MSLEDAPRRAAVAAIAGEYREGLRHAVQLIRALDGGGELTTSQVTTLNMIAEKPRRVGDIARFSGIKLPSATEQVSRLASAGLVHRVPSTDDARVVLVEITDAGRAAVKAANDVRNDFVADGLQALDAAELRTLQAALPVMAKLNAALGASSDRTAGVSSGGTADASGPG